MRPRLQSGAFARPLNFTVRGRNKTVMGAKVRKPAWAKTLRLKLQQRARAICKAVGAVVGFSCVCRICGCV